MNGRMNRRRILVGGLASAASGTGTAWAVPYAGRHNISSFTTQDWRDHFDHLGVGTIICDTDSRALHFWSGDGREYRIYPTSVPTTEELEKRGYTDRPKEDRAGLDAVLRHRVLSGLRRDGALSRLH